MKLKIVGVRRGYSGCRVFVDYEITDDSGATIESASACFSEERWSDAACQETLEGILRTAQSARPDIIEAAKKGWLGKEIQLGGRP